MEPLSPMSRAAKELLARYRDARPGPGTRARNWSAVASRIDARRWHWWWVGAAAFALAAAALVLALALSRGLQAVAERRAPGDAAIDARVSTDERVVVATPAPVVAVAPVVEAVETSRPAPVRPPSPARAAPPPRVDPLDRETDLLAEIRAAIDRDDRTVAAERIAAHVREFAEGVFVEERRAYAVVLACRRGDDAAASQRTAFSTAFPGSPHVKMIDAACDGIEPRAGKRE